MATPTPRVPATTAMIRPLCRSLASEISGLIKALYKSLEKDDVIIYKTASAALTSAEKIAARAKADAQKGIHSFMTMGSANSRSDKLGTIAAAVMPRNTGIRAKANMTRPHKHVPRITVFLFLAPYTLPIRPGEIKNDGVSIKKKPMIVLTPAPSKLK